MKYHIFCILISFLLILNACDKEFNNLPTHEYITLDLGALPDTIAYDTDGAWIGTYLGEISPITIQDFSFAHFGTLDNYGFPTWEGFTICCSERTNYQDYNTDQWNITAGGGKAGKGTPYILCYYSGWTVNNDILFTNACNPQEIYFCQTAWALECIKHGCNTARKFEQGDYFAIIIEGLDAEQKLIANKKVYYYLADYRSSNSAQWILNTTWDRCDLTTLGKVFGLRFTMKSSDESSYDGGVTYYSNTTTYFALDGLTIKKEE